MFPVVEYVIVRKGKTIEHGPSLCVQFVSITVLQLVTTAENLLWTNAEKMFAMPYILLIVR